MNLFFPGSTDQQDEVLRALGHKPPEKVIPPPPPKEYETHVFDGIKFEIEKGAHWDMETAIQIESLKLLRQIADELSSINRQIPLNFGDH